MRTKKSSILIYFLLFLMIAVLCLPATQNFSEIKGYSYDEVIPSALSTSGGSNNDIIESVFDWKIQDYNNHSYYSQIYDSSLQATYYALYILKTLGKLDTINQTVMINYLLFHYESSSNRFMDSLSYRYLNTDTSRDWSYPYSTALETTCYAILSLNILESLGTIDTQGIIDYLWSCYNTDTSGFIGRPYHSSLPAVFNLSTMDNTFYAVITLDLLMDDWLVYQDQKNEIIQFINDLQIPGGASWQAGGFFNDEDTGFDSLSPLFEPNLLSSFYSIKTLEVFGMEDTINVPDFHQFLNNSYDSLLNYFHIAPWDYPEELCNIAATALGLELSDITGFTDIDRTEVINFILSNRNSLRNWDQSTIITHHELIDTFQIVRSLENSQVISQLTLQEKDEIGNATQLYDNYNGYALLSKDYTSMNLVNTIVRSFELYGRLGYLDIQELYSQITGSFTENYLEMLTNSFLGHLQKSSIFESLRSFPIEYFTDTSFLKSHKTTYYALDSLNRMFKLDDFLAGIDGNELVSDIVATQFLNDSYYDTFGAFTPLWPYNSYYKSSFLDSKILFEYSYYAVKSLELLSDQLSLGNLSAMGVDTLALYTYIDRNTVETTTELYFDPFYTTNIETILEYTYYMIYILKTLDMYAKDSQKILTYVENNLNYQNIKNIYFSYKISEILDLAFEFDIDLTHQLVKNIYSEQNHEFYYSTSSNLIRQENFYWISEMARKSKIIMDTTYSNPIELGGYNHIEVSLDNLILHDFGSYITFKFESDQLGTHPLTKQTNGNYIANISVLFDPSNYLLIEGNLRAYEGSKLVINQYLSFNTTYSLQYNCSIQEELNRVQIFLNSSIVCSGERYPLELGGSFVKIYVDDSLNTTKLLPHENFIQHSEFNMNFQIANDTKYTFNVYLNDSLSNTTIVVGTAEFYKNSSDNPDDPDDPPDNPDLPDSTVDYDKEIQTAIPLTIIFLVAPGIVLISSSLRLKNSKNRLPQK